MRDWDERISYTLKSLPNPEKRLFFRITQIIAETNGISLTDTLDLLAYQVQQTQDQALFDIIVDFQKKLADFNEDCIDIQRLLSHSVSKALYEFFKCFPLRYHEEHIHLTGSLNAQFIYPRLNQLLSGPKSQLYLNKLYQIYGNKGTQISSVEDVDKLIRLKDGEGFAQYLKILYLPKIILVDGNAHFESAYHLAHELYHQFNIGSVRLKFSISRATSMAEEEIPGADTIQVEDVIMGLYQGFRAFQKNHPDFHFVLSPSFRKEASFFDASRFKNRQEHFEHLINQIVRLLDRYPDLIGVMTDVDTVGNEEELYRKGHFAEFRRGFRKLQYRGFRIRSHHGETFKTLKKGIQAVDNAMNIWHIDTLEHGLSLGINPNYYFHRMYQRVIELNSRGIPIDPSHPDYRELVELDWASCATFVLDKLLGGVPLTKEDTLLFLKAKFHTAREVEHYQHDVLNRMIQKGVGLVTLPSSNKKLTGHLDDYKDHPFSWWEKKGVQLSLGTDNYITLNTDYIREMLILLYSDPRDLKITKLLMVTTHENRRPYLSHLLWKMHKKLGELESQL
ncbi:MAG: hypothetical protein NZ480_08280 [Bdellovibrionaceae bacterium]|nr:hypothetical protein [Pseudobdellovibrionaceae bacterium]MDW8190922.1 hypothetical protein [Pseudobdellovibrionaceae bacterium]